MNVRAALARLAAVGLALLAAGVAGPGAGSACAESLREAVETALRSNPEPRAAQAQLGAQVGVLDQARAARYPSLDLRLAKGREIANNINTRAVGFQERRLNPDESSLTWRWPIFDNFQIRSEVSRQDALVGAARYRLAETWEDVALRTAAAYLEVLRDQSVIGLAQENLEDHRRTLEKVSLRYDRGVGNKADVQQAEGRLAQARSDLTAQQGTLEDSRARYLRLVGKAPGALQTPSGGEQAMIPSTLEAAIERAYEASPTIKIGESQLSAADSAVERARGNLKPSFDLEVSHTRNNDVDGVPGPSTSTAGFIVMRYNLFRGGGDVGQVRENLDRRTAALENLDNARVIVRENVARAWAALVSAREALPDLERHARSAEEVVEAFQSQFALGRRTLLDLLNAHSELFRARADVVSGRYAVDIARYRVLAAMGGFVEALGIRIEPAVQTTEERVGPILWPREPVR